MKKEVLRNKYKNLRAEIPFELREQMSLDIANRLLTMPIWEGNTFHLFLPIERFAEVNTLHLLTALQGKDKNVVLPKMDLNSHSLIHILLTDNTILKQNNWGIMEPTDGIIINPKQIDVVFVPLLAYDIHGNRVGYGKGFYDRFFAECRADVIKIGISYFEPETQIDDVSPSDIALDYCVTPTQIYIFRKN